MDTPTKTQDQTRLFAGFVAAALAVALVYHGILQALGLPFPWSTFLFTPFDRFDDWFSSVLSAATHDPYVKSKGSYFPFAYLPLLLGNAASNITSYAIYAAMSCGLMAAGVFLFWKNAFTGPARAPATLAALLLIAFLSYPMLFALDRGNLDLWIGGLCLIYVAELRKPLSWLGPVALAIAIAFKGYPMALILLGLQQRRFAGSAVAVVLAIALTILALLAFQSPPLTSWHAFQMHQREFWLVSVLGSGSMSYSDDPYNAIRGLAWIGLHAWQQIHAPAAPAVLNVANARHVDLHEHAKFLKSVGGASSAGSRALVANAYVALTTIFAAFSTFFVLFAPVAAWRRVAVAAVITILYPHVAQDYKLILMLPVAYTLLADAQVPEADANKSRTTALALVALLLVPKSYLFFYGIGITMILNPILLVALWWVAVRDFAAWKDGLQNFRAILTPAHGRHV
jgi:hypothetical protein